MQNIYNKLKNYHYTRIKTTSPGLSHKFLKRLNFQRDQKRESLKNNLREETNIQGQNLEDGFLVTL